MDAKLTLSDGTELEHSYVIRSGNNLWVYVYAQITFTALFGLLNDPENTAAITMKQGDEETVFEGFTDFFCIRKEDDGFISAGLRK